MKKRIAVYLWSAALVFIFSSTTSWAASSELDQRINEARLVMQEIMAAPDQSIPEEMLAKCKAIAIYPNVLKGGFIFGAKFGKGVVLKKDEKTGQWGPAAFSTIGGGSWGLQIGGEMADIVLVIMNERGINALLSTNVKLGAEAGAAAGPVGRDSSGGTDLTLRAGILSYSRSRGLFGGVAVEGAVLTQDNNSNTEYYGKAVTSRDILLGGAVSAGSSSKELMDNLNEYSTRWNKRIGATK